MRYLIFLGVMVVCGGCVSRPLGRYEAVATISTAEEHLALRAANQSEVGHVTVSLQFHDQASCIGAGRVSLVSEANLRWHSASETFDIIRFSRDEVQIASELFASPITLKREAGSLRAGDIIFLKAKPPNKASEPTTLLVTPRADARVAPSRVVAHL